MKKRFAIIATAVAAMFGFAACEGDNPFENLTDVPDLLGHINLTVSEATAGDQAYADGDVLNFASAMSNVNLTIEDTLVVDYGSVLIGTEANLLSGNVANITFPLIGINLRDTVTGNYEINCPVNQISFFENLDTSDWRNLITKNQPNLGNIFVVAANEHAMYIGYEGTVNITKFNGMGTLVEGTVNNVKALYVTEQDIEDLMDEDDPASINIVERFPHVTFNGEIASRRADMQAVLQALDAEAR